jgi:ABC-type spermidine/putrescine transport system permease subunit II
MIKFGVSPEINALSTLMLGATLLLVVTFFKPGKSNLV